MSDQLEQIRCVHCGDPVRIGGAVKNGLAFCCNGCRAVYEILHPSPTCPLVDPATLGDERFAYLDDPAVIKTLISFSDGTTSAADFAIPQMHCSSCVWLLENLYRLDPGIVMSRVDFPAKMLSLRYREPDTTLRKVVELLTALGYEPRITLASAARTKTPADNSLYYRIGIAGFCFGNIMILKFPEYLSAGTVDPFLQSAFSWLIVVLSLPVVFYCSTLYFRFAAGGLRKGMITVDVPIALGITILFVRSVADLLGGSGAGYFDSLAGLVFFLLLGRLFQQKTYESLNFERTYESYFPLAVAVIRNGVECTVRVSAIRPGDRMVIRNDEIIPADAVLLDGPAHIDYSFVTGESRTIRCETGTLVYAGARHTGAVIVLEAVAESSQSYLTHLWNNIPATREHTGRLVSVSTTFSRYFTFAVLAIAAMTGIVWAVLDPARAWNAATAVLIVACPCALALAAPFAFGTAQRMAARARLFIKDIAVVERLSHVTDVILDKTGTLTQAHGGTVRFAGDPLTARERSLVAALVRNSHHPLSRSVLSMLEVAPLPTVQEFVERANQGLEGVVDGERLRLGSAAFAGGGKGTVEGEQPRETRVYLTVNGSLRGYFGVTGKYRDGLADLTARLGERHRITVLTGDSDWERQELRALVGSITSLQFGKTPEAKREFVMALQEEGKTVLMIGDGLNDAVALGAADVGIALTEDVAAFTPASDAILDGASLTKLDRFLAFARSSKNVVVWSYGISVLYNIIGLLYAISGTLSPLLAAILMPLSSITVIVFTTISVRLAARTTGVVP